jgi:hypothetical protein
VSVTTYINCTDARSLPYSEPLPALVTYEIQKPAIQTFFAPIDDPMSKTVPLCCGPITYKMYSTDSTGKTMLQIPDFIIFIEENRQFDIYATNTGRAGTYYLLIDAFYTFLQMEKTAYHHKEIIKIVLTLPPPPTFVMTPPPPPPPKPAVNETAPTETAAPAETPPPKVEVKT